MGIPSSAICLFGCLGDIGPNTTLHCIHTCMHACDASCTCIMHACHACMHVMLMVGRTLWAYKKRHFLFSLFLTL